MAGNTLPTLSLNGSEPLAGYNILAIEGSLNGQTFACSGSACDVPLNEGNNDFTFWALSSYGDSSEMGTLSVKVDTVSPNVGLDVIGSNGTNNWYVSPITISATGSDSTSGLSNVLLSVNGGAWTASATLNEGVHAVDVRAEDNAGNVSASSAVISVDITTPSVDVSITGTVGSNGWYSSSMQVTATANDTTSGVGSLESSLDGGVYQAYNSPVSFVDGYHTVQFKAVDKAGNETETSAQEFYVDTIAPAVDLPAEWEVNDTITYKVQDDGSGLSGLRIVIEDEDEKFAKVAWDEAVSGDKFKGEITWNGKFKDGTIAPPGEYLVWVKAKDRAGNERFGLGRVIVKLESGQISVSANRPAGTRLDYKVSVVDEGFEFAGTKYNPSTVGNITSKGLLKSAVSKGALALTGLVAFGSNMWEFGRDEEFGSPEYWDAAVKNREFWVSTGVDFGVSVLVGLAAAGVVAASIAGFVALGVTAAATAPLWAVVGVTVIVGIFIGMGVDALGIPKMAKTWLNGLFTNP